MLDHGALAAPIVGAPMAGGPSTPRLAAAVSDAGGLGYLAGAYITAERLAEDVRAVRELTDASFGVNLFVPEERPSDREAVARYAQALRPLAERWGVSVPAAVPDSDDGFGEKLAVLIEAAVPAVSFTFGCPPAATIERLHAVGTAVTVTVTTADDARTAASAGADALCVQGAAAGGHRSTFAVAEQPNDLEAEELLALVRDVCDLPLVAAGGVRDHADVRRLLGAGAVAVQVGTALLLTPEAGTKPAHRAALVDPARDRTAVTRAYSGRPARGLLNAFIEQFDALAPAEYPQVNTMTGALRRAAADDPDVLNLWAGTGFAAAREASVADVVRALAGHDDLDDAVG